MSYGINFFQLFSLQIDTLIDLILSSNNLNKLIHFLYKNSSMHVAVKGLVNLRLLILKLIFRLYVELYNSY